MTRLYLLAATPFAPANVAYNSVLNSLSSDDAAAARELNAANGAYSDALTQFDLALMPMPWPASFRADVQAVEMTDMALQYDLGVPVTATTLRAWGRQMIADRDKSLAALKALQAVPGLLPPAPVTP